VSFASEKGGGGKSHMWMSILWGKRQNWAGTKKVKELITQGRGESIIIGKRKRGLKRKRGKTITIGKTHYIKKGSNGLVKKGSRKMQGEIKDRGEKMVVSEWTHSIQICLSGRLIAKFLRESEIKRVETSEKKTRGGGKIKVVGRHSESTRVLY